MHSRELVRAAGLAVAKCRFAKLRPGEPGDRVLCGIIGERPGLPPPPDRLEER
jgi:hypothetical protein